MFLQQQIRGKAVRHMGLWCHAVRPTHWFSILATASVLITTGSVDGLCEFMDVHGRFLMLVGGYPFEDTAGQPHTAVRKIVSGQYAVPSDVPLSESCLDLISRIFTVNPLQRITIAQIKQHPWFVRRMPKAMMVRHWLAQVVATGWPKLSCVR